MRIYRTFVLDADTWNMGLMSVMRVLLGQSMADDDLPYSLALRVELNVMGKESFQFGSSAKKSMMQHLYIGYEDVVHGWKIRAIQVGCPTVCSGDLTNRGEDER